MNLEKYMYIASFGFHDLKTGWPNLLMTKYNHALNGLEMGLYIWYYPVYPILFGFFRYIIYLKKFGLEI